MVAGLAVSAAVHAAAIGAFFLLSLKETPDHRGLAEAHADGVMQVSLVTMADTGAMHASPAPLPPAAPSSPAPSPGRVAPQAADSPSEPAASPAPIGPAGAASNGQSAASPPVLAAADPAIGNDYRRRLYDHIAGYRRPPPLAPGERSNGTVMVRFALTRGGEVLAATVATSSGVPDLDDEAVATIWRAQPMPPIPVLLPGRLTVTLPVTFGGTLPGGAG